MRRRNPFYLVQVRGHGESWKTVQTFGDFLPAARWADTLADETQEVPWTQGETRTIRAYAYVRVVHSGGIAYDPHAPKASAPAA